MRMMNTRQALRNLMCKISIESDTPKKSGQDTFLNWFVEHNDSLP